LEGKIRTDQWVDKDGITRSQKKIRGLNLTIINREKNKLESDGHASTKLGDVDLNDGLNESYMDENYHNEDIP
jgi:single-stranded DNA-binding protein